MGIPPQKNGYKPDFVPLEDEYKAAQEKLRDAKRPWVAEGDGPQSAIKRGVRRARR
jgi:hypothetical protein